MLIRSVNPATEEVNKEFETISTSEVKKSAKSARVAFAAWKATDHAERRELLRKLSSVLRQKSKEYGRIITIEMGKPIKQAVSEVEKCALAADVFAENAEKWLEDETVHTEYRKSLVSHEPLGVILGIMPWNFPFWQAMRFAIPAVSAGNTTILRHSSVCPMSSECIEESFRLSGFPEGVFTNIIAGHDSVKSLISGNGLVDGVSLTGSVEAGKRIGAVAGRNIKKVVLELGGSDPFIVLDDADMNKACVGACDGRLVNSGQSCICSKRFIVVESMVEEFVEGLASLMKSQRLGDPLDDGVTVGPLASKQQLELVESQVKGSVEMGAKIVCGGKRTAFNNRGFFFEPTVMRGVDPRMPAFREEVFGPVAPVAVAKNEKDAVRLANKSNFGLGASVWTSDAERGERVARLLNTGMVFINHIVVSDPRMPFGGVKNSGVGRELSRFGILEFTNTKSIVVQ